MLERYSRFVVTGGCGFIGRHLVFALMSRNKDVIIVDNLSTSAETAIPHGARFICSDIRDAECLGNALTDADVIFHFAGNSNGTISVNQPEYDYEVNAAGTANILRQACKIKAKRFIYLSTASVYGRPIHVPIPESHPTNPFMPYGKSKLEGERLSKDVFEKNGLPVLIARPFCVYGDGENPRASLVEVSRYVRWHLNGKAIQIVGDENKKTRDFVHVDDVVLALMLIADQGKLGEVYNIGTGAETSLSELVHLIEKISRTQANVRTITQIQDDSYRLVSDISKIKALGFSPSIFLEPALKHLIRSLGDKPTLPKGTTIFRPEQVAEVEC